MAKDSMAKDSMTADSMIAPSRAPFRVLLLYAAFFLSGLAALVYQLLWQRSLFTLFGSSSESVTLVVTAFMLGLGLGGLAGGALSRRVPQRLPLLFSAAELCIGAFGLVSLPLFHWVATFTAEASPFEVGFIAFALLLVPTVLMGATLPILVTWAVQRTSNVGRSVGTLYFVNTLGAAIGAFACAFVLFGALGQRASLGVAAGINFTVGAALLLQHLTRKRA